MVGIVYTYFEGYLSGVEGGAMMVDGWKMLVGRLVGCGLSVSV